MVIHAMFSILFLQSLECIHRHMPRNKFLKVKGRWVTALGPVHTGFLSTFPVALLSSVHRNTHKKGELLKTISLVESSLK